MLATEYLLVDISLINSARSDVSQLNTHPNVPKLNTKFEYRIRPIAESPGGGAPFY